MSQSRLSQSRQPTPTPPTGAPTPAEKLASFCLLVTGSYTVGEAHLHGLRFARAALASGHKVEKVFFYGEAVAIASLSLVLPTDEPQIAAQWRSLSAEHQFPLEVCVTAAARRGILDRAEAVSIDLTAATVNPDFAIVGLGQLAVSMSNPAIKLIHFN